MMSAKKMKTSPFRTFEIPFILARVVLVVPSPVGGGRAVAVHGPLVLLLRGRRSLEVARVDGRVGGRWQRAGGMGLRGGAACVVLPPRTVNLLTEVGGHGVCGRHLESFYMS